VASFQGLQWNLTECYTSLFSARLARNRAASILERRSPEMGLATSIAKKLATDAAEKVAYEMFSLVGSFGLYRANDLSVVLNDIKVLRVAGGSLEVLRNYVAKELLKSETYLGMR
jgi:alkylation response protein AidB-like acyl-CoA dehydrogenase